MYWQFESILRAHTIHIDANMDNTAKEPDTFDLSQHMKELMHMPMHRGHTLDLVISKGLDIPSIMVKDLAHSDHYCILFDFRNTLFKKVLFLLRKGT